MSGPGELWKVWQATVRRDAAKVVAIETAPEREWTAANVTARALEWSAVLGNFRRGQRVAFQLPNGAEWLAFFLALQERGLAAMPLDGGLPLKGSLDLARRLQARACLVHGKLKELDPGAPVTRAACIKITSGSSGAPKAIGCRAEHLLADGRQVTATMGLRPRDRNLAAIPLGHSYGLGNLVMPLIAQGTAVVCAAEYLPRQLVDWMTRHRVTVFPGVPALFRVLAALPAGTGAGDLRLAISAGAMLAAGTAQAFHERYGVRIHNFYGSSETGGIAYDRSGEASRAGRSVGAPLKGVTVTIRAGRLTVTSPAVAAPGGSWRPPDHGEWNAQGELVLLGRAGPGANIGGKKVHPREIEETLRALPGVGDAHVWFEHGHGHGSDLLAAAVETKLTRGRLEHALAERLPAWKMPRHWHVAARLPRTARGKLDTAHLRAAAKR